MGTPDVTEAERAELDAEGLALVGVREDGTLVVFKRGVAAGVGMLKSGRHYRYRPDPEASAHWDAFARSPAVRAFDVKFAKEERALAPRSAARPAPRAREHRAQGRRTAAKRGSLARLDDPDGLDPPYWLDLASGRRWRATKAELREAYRLLAKHRDIAKGQVRR
jgi:hypothetical protein